MKRNDNCESRVANRELNDRSNSNGTDVGVNIRATLNAQRWGCDVGATARAASVSASDTLTGGYARPKTDTDLRNCEFQIDFSELGRAANCKLNGNDKQQKKHTGGTPVLLMGKMPMLRNGNPKSLLVGLVLMLFIAVPAPAQQTPVAAPIPASQPAMPGIGDVLKAVDKATGPDKAGKASEWSSPIKLAVAFTGLALLPSLLVMMTSFTRIIIVLSFVRRALTTQTIPPTVALIGLALFLTLYTMSPTFGHMNQQALQPYINDQITMDTACLRSNNLLKEFMVRQTRPADIELFLNLASMPKPETVNDLPLYVEIPAFAISEFRKSFEMGCLLFIPFLLVDLVISGILLSAGMMMLPPSMISLPFKIILFVLVDGWRLLAQTLVGSFNY